MKPYAVCLLMAAGLVWTGCETRNWSGSGASSGPGYVTTSGTVTVPRLDRNTRMRLQAESPQTYTRLYQGQPLGMADIGALSRAGVTDDVIISQIAATRSVYHPSTSDIIDLHNSGVSERVIDYMASTGSGVYPLSSPETATPVPTVVVNQAPPPAPAETVVASPNPNYVWIPGEWTWNERWIWMPGRWTQRPFSGAEWVKGTWVRTPQGWRQDPGHWR